MDQHLKSFVAQWLRVALTAALPVALTAFVTIPVNLGAWPGEQMQADATAARHMT